MAFCEKERRQPTSLDLWSNCFHFDRPSASRHAVRHTGIDQSRHTLLRIGRVRDRERNRVVGERRHVPETIRPIIGPTMQRVVAVVCLCLVCLAIERICCIANTVHIATGDGIVHRMSRILCCWICQRCSSTTSHCETWNRGITVKVDIIVAKHNIHVFAILVLDEQVCKRCAVRNELDNN